jgi:hypothetical protein
MPETTSPGAIRYAVMTVVGTLGAPLLLAALVASRHEPIRTGRLGALREPGFGHFREIFHSRNGEQRAPGW